MRRPLSMKKGKVVLAAGVFDLLHIGHVKFLEEAKKVGGENSELIVIVARDSTVEKRKGEKPVVPEAQRRALVEALKVVDTALLGYEEFNMEKVIEKIMPDIIAVGYDQRGIEEELRKIIQKKGLEIDVVRIGKFGQFYACSNFPKCRHTEPLEKSVLGIKCPKCQKGEIVEKRTKKGKIFYGCNQFPKCDFALWDKPLAAQPGTGQLCPKCNSLLVKKGKQIKCSNKECKENKSSSFSHR